MANSVIDWKDIVGEKTLDKGGYTGDLMTLADEHLKKVIEAGHVSQSESGRVYASMISVAISNGINFGMNKELMERKIDISAFKAQLDEVTFEVAEATKQDKIDTSAANLFILEGGKQFKIDITEHQATKALNDANLVAAQQKALEEQVIDNRKIKAISALSSTYGTIGAGGLTLSDDMWEIYFSLIIDLVNELKNYQGTWNAATNVPNIGAIEEPVVGDFYRVDVAGTIDLDGISSWLEGDIVYYDGTKWDLNTLLVPTDTSVTGA